MSENNTAFIDGANLHKSIENLEWYFDYAKFRVWLREKFNVQCAYMFLGKISKYKERYETLQAEGFNLFFKDVIFNSRGQAKGNCDADLIVHVMQEAYENKFDKAILVTSDGDFAPLIKFLMIQDKLDIVLSPYPVNKCSLLIKRTNAKIAYITDQQSILEAKNEKAPDGDETP